jgi:hypothetical protein
VLIASILLETNKTNKEMKRGQRGRDEFPAKKRWRDAKGAESSLQGRQEASDER